MIARRTRLALSTIVFLTLAVAFTSQAQPQFTCGDATEPPGVSASDALAVLRSAVGLVDCSLCTCDTDGSGKVSATDALFTLKSAVGQQVTLKCPFCCEHCACTPQKLALTLSDVAPCEGCIPRNPPANDVNSIMITFADGLDGEYELTAVAECVWQTSLPAAIADKVFYGSDTDCTGSPTHFSDIDVTLQVVRSADHWEVYAGMYVLALQWGDALRASVASGSCEIAGSAQSQNSVCELADVNDPTDYDIHATSGNAGIEITDPEPVCP